MDSHRKTPRKLNARKSVSARLKSMSGTIGLSLTLYGAITAFGSLFMFVFALSADILAILVPLEVFAAVVYCGFLLGITGGILGIVSLSRGKDIIASGIAVILGILMFCSCGVLTFNFISTLYTLRTPP